MVALAAVVGEAAEDRGRVAVLAEVGEAGDVAAEILGTLLEDADVVDVGRGLLRGLGIG